MIDSFMIMLPNIVLALIVFAIFYFVGRQIKRVVRRLTRHHHQARNLGLVLGRLAQSVIV
ncbi:mechanosensitive ion channel family protein [Microcoleus sp. POL10_C6]